MKDPHIEVIEQPCSTGFDAFFSIRLERIGVSDTEDARRRAEIVELLDGQVDFIAALTGLGDDCVVELRFAAHPQPATPHLGHVDVTLRVRLPAKTRKLAQSRAIEAINGFYPALISMHEAYDWVLVSDLDEYRRMFDVSHFKYVGELTRRHSNVRMDRIDPLPPRWSIGFSNELRPDNKSEGSSVHVIFPFKQSKASLARLFDFLLLQPEEILVTILLSPARLQAEELDFLVEQSAKCERYLQLPIGPVVSDISSFSPPLRGHAALLRDQLSKTIFALRNECFELSLQIASTAPVNPLLVEVVSTVLTGQASGEVSSAENPVLLEGGCEWSTPATEAGRKSAIEKIDQMVVEKTIPSKAGAVPGRIGRLFDTRQANCAFRFPLPVLGSFPGLTTRRSISLPPPVTLPSHGLFIGENVHRGMRQPVYLLDDDRRRHLYTVGQTGTGKSSLLLSMILQDIEAGKGVGVLDPHGELVDEILPRIPASRVSEVRYINVEDREHAVGINMLQFSDPMDRERAINHLIEMFWCLYGSIPESLGPMFEQYFRNSALLEMQDSENPLTLDGILRIFADKNYRTARIRQCKDPIVRSFWQLAIESSGESALSNLGGYVTNKLSPFIYNQLLRDILLQPQSTINFSDVLDQGQILLVDLSKGSAGDSNMAFLAMIIVSQIQRAAFARTSQDISRAKDFYLYIDEFQNVATESFVSILSEARKYRLNAILANQYIHQIPEDVRDAVGGNVGSIIAFRSGAKDAELLEQEFSPMVGRDDLMNLPNFEAYMSTLTRGEATPPFSIRTKLITNPGDPNVTRAIRQGVANYSRPIAEVEAMISRRWATDY